MSTWQTGSVEANGVLLHYNRTGGARPPLVLAHGFSDDGLCWSPVARELEDAYDIVMVDARCHGRSSDPREPYGPLDQSDDLAAVITALELRRPAVLGHSMGAITTLGLAGKYPDLPGVILLEDPPPWWVADPAASADDERRQRMRDRIVALKRKTREELIAEQRAMSPGWSEDELGPWADSKLRLSFNVLNRAPAAEVDWVALATRVRCPALLITADTAMGAIVDQPAGERLRELIPQLQIAHIPEAGHSIRRERFGRYMAVVRAFLADTAARIGRVEAE
jgi:pimeloyl-ACP methyl ester carboxylesterase